MRLRALLVILWLAAAPAAAGVAAQAAPPQSPAAAQDGFVPVDKPMNAQDTMPAPRLVAAAYAVVWLALFGYIWSIRTRLGSVERELDVVKRRAATGDRPR